MESRFTRELSGVREQIEKNQSILLVAIQGQNTKIEKNQSILLVAIQGQNTKIEQNQSILLVAIQGQNTKFEAFKLHIYKLIGGVAAAVIGYANRDRLLQGIASVIK